MKAKATPATPTEAQPKKLIAADMWSEALHVALRKCCDSDASSAAWNLIYLLKDGKWSKYVKFVHETVTADTSTNPTWQKLECATNAWKPYGEGHDAVALYCVFEMFSDSDWMGYAGYLEEAD